MVSPEFVRANRGCPLPSRPRPIVMIGAGGIVRDAHLPAYRLAGFSVASIFDLDSSKAVALALEFCVPHVASTLSEAIHGAPREAVYDVAVPASAILPILHQLPEGAAVLIHKPMGESIDEARGIVELCRTRRLVAAVNFQLRYAPNVAAARELLRRGTIGELHDMEVRVTVFTPWHLWTFLQQRARVEILYHSIHYLDLMRSFLGEPRGVYAKTVRHPAAPQLAATRSAILLDYGDERRATITTNHGHNFGRAHQESYVKWEGTRGAIKARLGLLLDYPRGEADALEFCVRDSNSASEPEWKAAPFEGRWFPHAFIGTMASVMRFANGETTEFPTRVEDAFNTMGLVEAAYASSAAGGVVPPTWS